MPVTVNIDGRIVSEQQASISVFDHGFLYGEGVYEVLRTYRKEPFLYEPHMTRLRQSAEQIALTVPWTDAELHARIASSIAAADIPVEAYIRILLTRGVGELVYDPAACPNPTTVIIIKPHVESPATVYEDGVTISLVPIVRNHPASLNPRIKSNNLLNNALAMQEALKAGADEALMCNQAGEIVECSQSNFFIVRKGEVLTPPLSAGLLPGITRAFVMELAAELGIPAREQRLIPEDLKSADEAFITGTTREVTPVVLVDSAPIGSGKPGPISRQLLDLFRRRADELTSR